MTTALPGTADAAEPYADLTLSNLADVAAARNNLGVQRTVTPEQFGAVGDGKADDAKAIQDAIDAVSKAGGGVVSFTAHVYLVGSTLILRQGVTLDGGRRHKSLVLDSEGCVLRAKAGLTGWLIDTVPNVWNLGAAVIGFNILGPGLHLSDAVGAIRLRQCYGTRLQYLTINSFSDSCIRVDKFSVAISIQDCCIQTDSSGRTLTAVCGSLELHGSDHSVRSVQCNGGPADPQGTAGNLKVTYPGKFFRTGAYITAHTSWIFDLNGEFGDVGIYVGKEAGSNGTNRFIGSRADVNAGHGWYIDGANVNQFVGCSAFMDGCAEADRYDGAIHVNGASMNAWTNFQYHPVALPLNMRYAWNDETTGNKPGEENTVDLPNTSLLYMGRDVHNTADPVSYPLRASGSGPTSRRLPSRYMAGGTWFDTTTGRPTYSDGSQWRDGDGNPVGNVLTPNQATGRDALEWESDGTATITAVAPLSVATLYPHFNVAKVAQLAATSAADGSFVIRSTTKFPVQRGRAYTIGCRTMAKSQPAGVRISVDWFDANGRHLATSRSAVTTNSTSDITISRATAVRPPGHAAEGRLAVEFARAGMASGETHYLSYAFVVPAEVNDYVEP